MSFTAGDLLVLIGMCLAGIIWMVRGEGRHNNLQSRFDENKETIGHEISEIKAKHDKDLSELKLKHEALDSKIMDKLSTIEITLAKIVGRLSIETDKKQI